MSKQLTRQNAIFVKDDDGHDYCIHEDNEKDFYDKLEKAYKGYGEDYDIFVNKYSSIGMSPNLYRKEYLK